MPSGQWQVQLLMCATWVHSDTNPCSLGNYASAPWNLTKLEAQQVLSETEQRFNFLNMKAASSEPQTEQTSWLEQVLGKPGSNMFLIYKITYHLSAFFKDERTHLMLGKPLLYFHQELPITNEPSLAVICFILSSYITFKQTSCFITH